MSISSNLTPTHSETVDSSKRTLMAVSVAGAMSATAGLATRLFADESGEQSKHVFEMVQSTIGIQYEHLAPYPLSAILSQGEAEWIKNATPKYGDKAASYWKKAAVVSISKGAISDNMISKLKKYTPEMLNNFAVGLHPSDPKYSYLWSIGNANAISKIAKAFGA